MLNLSMTLPPSGSGVYIGIMKIFFATTRSSAMVRSEYLASAVSGEAEFMPIIAVAMSKYKGIVEFVKIGVSYKG